MTGSTLDPKIVAAAMRKALRELCRANGVIFDPDLVCLDPSRFYRFAPEEVIAIHNHKRGAGTGIWFRLRDGRVFDRTGAPDQRDPALYDTWRDE